MVSSSVLMSEETAHVSGCTIFKMTNNIALPSYLRFKAYKVLNYLNLYFTSVVSEFLVNSISILDLRRCWSIIAFLEVPFYYTPSFVVEWCPRYYPELSFHSISQCEYMIAWVIKG